MARRFGMVEAPIEQARDPPRAASSSIWRPVSVPDRTEAGPSDPRHAMVRPAWPDAWPGRGRRLPAAGV